MTHPAMIIPVDTLLFRSEGLRVVTVDGQNHAHLQVITVGRDWGTKIEVLSGLTENDRIINNPPDSPRSARTNWCTWSRVKVSRIRQVRLRRVRSPQTQSTQESLHESELRQYGDWSGARARFLRDWLHRRAELSSAQRTYDAGVQSSCRMAAGAAIGPAAARPLVGSLRGLGAKHAGRKGQRFQPVLEGHHDPIHAGTAGALPCVQ